MTTKHLPWRPLLNFEGELLLVPIYDRCDSIRVEIMQCSAKTEQASAAAAERAKKAKAGGTKLAPRLRGSASGSKLVFGESCGSAVLDSNALMDAGELRTRLECFPHDGDTITSEAKAKKQLKAKASVRLKLEYKVGLVTL